MGPTSSPPSLQHQLIEDPEFPHSDIENESMESEEQESPSSNDETDYDFKPGDDESTAERSQLEITYSHNPDGGRSAIKEIKFFDARDLKSQNQWKVVLPFDKNQCHRVAAAMSIMCKDTTDIDGKLLPPDLGSRICGLLLDDMDMEKALNSMSVLYTTYRTEDKSNGYLRAARRELRHWYERRAKQTVGNKGNTRNIKITFQSGQLKRALETERDTARSPPAKRTFHTLSPKSLVAVEAIQVQSSPGISHPMTLPVHSSKGSGRRSSSDNQRYPTIGRPSLPTLPTLETHTSTLSPMKALEEIEHYYDEQLNKFSSAAPHLNEFLTVMGVSAPLELLDTVVKDDAFCNAVETLKTYVESAESKLLHAERKASEHKSRLEIAERHGWESERRRQEAEKRYEELESKRREEINEQTELKAKLAAIVAQLQNVAGGS